MNSRSSASMCSGSQVSAGAAGRPSSPSSARATSGPGRGHGHRAARGGRRCAPPPPRGRRTGLGHRGVDVALEAHRPPRRHPPSAVTTTVASASRMRSRSASDEKPPKTTEWTARSGCRPAWSRPAREPSACRRRPGRPGRRPVPAARWRTGTPRRAVGVADRPGVARLALPVERHLVAPARGHVPVEAVVGDVEGAPVEPPGEGQDPLRTVSQGRNQSSAPACPAQNSRPAPPPPRRHRGRHHGAAANGGGGNTRSSVK